MGERLDFYIFEANKWSGANVMVWSGFSFHHRIRYVRTEEGNMRKCT